MKAAIGPFEDHNLVALNKGHAILSAEDVRIRKLLWFVWVCFIARGMFYCVLSPIWEGFDEPYHFAFLQHVVVYHTSPRTTDTVSREIEASFHLLPLSWEQRLHSLAAPVYTEEAYWQMPEADRHALQEKLRSLPPTWAAEPPPGPSIYEAQQAPLYYWMFSIPLRLSWNWPLPARVMLIRMLGILLVSSFIHIAFATAKYLFENEGVALALVATIVCMPELMINLTRVGNESVSLVIYTAFALLLLYTFEKPHGLRLLPAVGLLLGLGLLSKAYFLTALPASIILVAWAIWQWPAERRRIAAQSALAFSLMLLISLWWYWRLHALTGSWSGEQGDVSASHLSLLNRFEAIAHVNWIGGMISVFLSHVWFGGWSFLKLPKWMYAYFGGGQLLPAAGLLIEFLRGAGSLRTSGSTILRRIFIIGMPYAFFWLGLLYHILVT